MAVLSPAACTTFSGITSTTNCNGPGTFHLLRIGASLFDSLLVMTPELLGLFARKNVTGLNRIDDDQPDKK